MGTDNLFHKRRAKSAKGLQRRTAKRDAYDKVLIVCEGEKTEPHYFHGLRNHYGLSTANVEVCGECGPDPNSVLSFAKQRYREEKDAGDPFDKVFCCVRHLTPISGGSRTQGRVGREHAMVAMAVPPRRRDQCREMIDELQRREREHRGAIALRLGQPIDDVFGVSSVPEDALPYRPGVISLSSQSVACAPPAA
jgi:hypothetical protein